MTDALSMISPLLTGALSPTTSGASAASGTSGSPDMFAGVLASQLQSLTSTGQGSGGEDGGPVGSMGSNLMPALLMMALDSKAQLERTFAGAVPQTATDPLPVTGGAVAP